MKKNILKAQKRVIKFKRRTINIDEYRRRKEYISIIANKNKRITEEQIKSIKIDILNPKGLLGGKLIKIFKLKILLTPNKILTNKGILVRMGGGKAKIKTKVLYITKNSNAIILIPINNNINMVVVNKLLKKFILKYSFFSFKSFI